MRVKDVGHVTVSQNTIRWKITNFADMLQLPNTVLYSRIFCSMKMGWKLVLCPNGWMPLVQKDWVGLGLIRYCDCRVAICVRLSFLAANGQKYPHDRVQCISDKKYSVKSMMRHSEFQSLKDQIIPGGDLLIYCEIKRCLTALPAELVTGKLQHDFQELLFSGNHSDMKLQVKGKEFKVHKNILGARSPVFAAMMEHEMKEKETGVVVIKDSDPDSFSEFLLYLYTGKVENHLTSQNVLSLFATADKYQVTELKAICVHYMMNNISMENFCDILTLSLQHNEKELHKAAAEFFVQNSVEIAATQEWLEFSGGYLEESNKLFIKALKERRPLQ